MSNTPEKLQHHELTAEWIDDQQGPAVILTQASQGYDEPNSVLIHPWQLRAACEHLGIIEASDPQAARTIAMLTRRLLVLNERIQHLDYWLRTVSDSAHANLDYEQSYAEATADIAREFCAELVDMPVPVKAAPMAPCKPDANTGPAPAPAMDGKTAPAMDQPQASLI